MVVTVCAEITYRPMLVHSCLHYDACNVQIEMISLISERRLLTHVMKH